MSYRSKRTKTTRDLGLESEQISNAADHPISCSSKTLLLTPNSNGLVGTQVRHGVSNLTAYPATLVGTQVTERVSTSVARSTGSAGTHVRERVSNSVAHQNSTQVRETMSNSVAHPNRLASTQVRKGVRSVEASLDHLPGTLDKKGSVSTRIQPTQTSRQKNTQNDQALGKGKRPQLVQSTSAPVNITRVCLDASGREASNESSEEGTEHIKGSKSKPFRPRSVKSRNVAPDWPKMIDFDEKEEVLTIDAEGKHMLLSGPIQARDVDLLSVGTRIFVHFNEFNQPVRRGGSILVKYLGNLAKNKRFCPIQEKAWDQVNYHLKADIIEVVRSRFVIPADAWIFNQAILMRVGKYLRQYKHTLKRDHFNPEVRTKEQIYNDVPDGQERSNWMHLVDHWYSDESKRLSQHGKVARATQSHVHTNGATSYAEKRADFVELHGRQPSHLEFFKMMHCKVDGTYVDNTLTSDFLVEATEKVNEISKSSTKSELEIHNEVFDSLMYEEGKPRKTVGFGFGVKESDVFGVKSLVRKTNISATGINSCIEMETLKSTISNMKEENQVALASMKEENQIALACIKKENEELRARVDQTNQILMQALNAMRIGTVSSEFLDAAQSALHVEDSHMASTEGES